MSKLFKHVSEIEFPSISSLFCCSRKKHDKKSIVDSYELIFNSELKILKQMLDDYAYFNSHYENIKKFKNSNDLEKLHNYIINGTTIDNVEEYWKYLSDKSFILLKKQLIFFESLQEKINSF